MYIRVCACLIQACWQRNHREWATRAPPGVITLMRLFLSPQTSLPGSAPLSLPACSSETLSRTGFLVKGSWERKEEREARKSSNLTRRGVCVATHRYKKETKHSLAHDNERSQIFLSRKKLGNLSDCFFMQKANAVPLIYSFFVIFMSRYFFFDHGLSDNFSTSSGCCSTCSRDHSRNERDHRAVSLLSDMW